jgi:Mrp family chromosome partitioning ATPase
LKATKINNLKILPCGVENINSVEALGSERMRNIVKELSLIADVVLFDSPPALMFSDPYLVGKLVNGVIIVSRVGMTRTEPLKRVVGDLRMAGINVAGVVIQHRKSSEMYGYRYYHHYYESDSETKKAHQISNTPKSKEGLTVELRKEEQQKP